MHPDGQAFSEKVSSYYRARPGAGVVQVAALAAVVVLWMLGRFQLAAPVSFPLVLAVMVAFVLVGAIADFKLLCHPTALVVHLRIASMVLAVAALAVITGWGPMLGIGFALVIFENIQRLGSERWRAVSGWCLVSVAVSVAAIAAGIAPSFVDREVLYALTGLNAVAIVFVAYMVKLLQAETERSKAKLALAAAHDHMTGLANRMAFLDRLKQALVDSRRSGRPVAVLFCDLIDFKDVNDTFGHEVGDAVLVEIAAKFEACTRARDLVARYAGDEFVVLLPDLESPRNAIALARRLIASLDEPLYVTGLHLRVGVSIGIAISSDARSTVRALLAQADLAMYSAKIKRRSAWRLHVPHVQPVCAFSAAVAQEPGSGFGDKAASKALEADRQLSA
ncbi:MAG: diguanylate cyclase domain-containing protein [Acidimicrobiales bacterium]